MSKQSFAGREFSVAPMMDITDRHCRAFLRLFSRRARLYTQMVVTGAIIHGDRERFLGFDGSEHPVAIQLGGSDPGELARCARLAEARGYDEVNLNVGCPSDRVRQGLFGACLMAKPELVADCVAMMKRTVAVPVTVKTRIGIDDRDSYGALSYFIRINAEAGCEHFIIHARKAWLKGLSPKENRTIPPLKYDTVYRLKADFPHLRFTLNGGVTDLGQAGEHLGKVDGVMMGRQAYLDPWLLSDVDGTLFGEHWPDRPSSRLDIVARYLPYIERELSRGVYLRHMTRHMLQLFHGEPGAKSWRRHLSEYGPRRSAGIEVIEQALRYVDDAGRDDASTTAGMPRATPETAHSLQTA
ncbi:MAG: tRNA dihydrouridine(20/20a) synthase DusA [Gammaproteobacteria bacterium]|nr:tRNA dihydrouridine(20/20a) synthase DusA [Gammaproteobacteria bacterium]